MYAFAIVLYEVIGRKGPFGQLPLEPKEIVGRVKKYPNTNEEPFRPDIEHIMDSNNCAEYVVNCIKECWDENPEVRPDFQTIRYQSNIIIFQNISRKTLTHSKSIQTEVD